MGRFCAQLVVMTSALAASAFLPEDNEPPVNPFLANSSWPMTHRNSYNQGSTYLPGPERGDRPGFRPEWPIMGDFSKSEIYWEWKTFKRPVLTIPNMGRFCAQLVFMMSALTANAFLPADNEPPVNPFLANSSWPMTHRNSYNQGSTYLPGPERGDRLEVSFTYLLPTIISLITTPSDPNGNRNFWYHGPFRSGKLVARTDSMSVVDSVFNPPTLNAFPGAYTLLDIDGAYFSFQDRTLRKFGNSDATDPINSSMMLLGKFSVPSELFRSDSDFPLGLNILYDGNLAFTTNQGILNVLSRDFVVLASLALGGDAEEISNNLAIDENGGIYVVTSVKMRKIQWDGTILTIAWESEYYTGVDEPNSAGRLGAGSGTTPSLMGTRPDDDKFVVITDAARLMNIVLFWRDEIPDDWQGLPGKDKRVAAETPITFGDPSVERSVTEQSVLIRGYGAMVVNNDYGVALPGWLPALLNQLFVLLTGFPMFTPKGMEKFVWDPSTRTLDSAWSNRISCPNGIPTMSASSNLAYCLGRRFFTWTIEAISWTDGSTSFYKNLGFRPRYNSAYSAMQVVENREILSGSLVGALRVQAKDL